MIRLKMEGDLRSGIRTNVLWVEEHPASGFATNFFQGVSYASMVVVGVGKDGGGHHQCLQIVLCDALEVAYAFRGLMRRGEGAAEAWSFYFLSSTNEEAMEGRMMSLKAII